MEYRKGPQTLYNIEYHVVWITTYRYQVLTGDVQIRVREFIRQMCQQHELTILKGHVSKDHIHILVSAPPQHAVRSLMQKLKGRSSRLLQQEFPHLRTRYWGQHLWARGSFCASVGQVTDDLIKAYIASHVTPSPDDQFTLEP